MTHEEFHDLACRYAEGTASPEDVRQLDDLLAADAGLRRTFLEILTIDAALEKWATAAEGTLPPVRRPGLRFVPPWAAAILVAVGIGGLLTGLAWRQGGQTPVASVIRQIGEHDAFRSGRLAVARRYELAAGMLEVMTATGVKVVFEAPATFVFESSQRVQLLRGRVAADVPPSGKGFTVVTPSGDAVDLGTSFGVAVGEAGESQVHVFEGEVIAQAKDGAVRSVRRNEAVSLSDGNAQRDMRTASFIRTDEMPSLTAGFAAGQMDRSRAAIDRIRRDPALIELFDFEGPELPGSHFALVQGRWPGSRAADFSTAEDFIPVTIGSGKTWPQLTFAAWVRLDRLRGVNQSLYHTDMWNDGTGHVHWMVSNFRSTRLCVKDSVIAADAPEPNGEPNASTQLSDALDRWVHLAVVYDSEKRTVRFFLDGRFDHESRLAVAPPAVLGRGRIGNWVKEQRFLSGRIDELIVLGRALSDEEIGELHAAGTPYR